MRERQKWLDWRFVSRDGLRGFVRDRHLEKVSVIEIPRRILHLAASCLSVPEGTGQKPAHPAALPSLLDYIWRHSRTVPLCAFNLPPRPSCHIWLLFFAVGCDMKMSTLSGGVCWWCWASHLSPLPSFALCDFSFFFFPFLCCCLLSRPSPSLYPTFFLFLPCADFSFTAFDCQLRWHSDLWSASRPEGALCCCVCVRLRRLSFETCVLVLYVRHSKSLFLVTSITASLCQLNLLSLCRLLNRHTLGKIPAGFWWILLSLLQSFF